MWIEAKKNQRRVLKGSRTNFKNNGRRGSGGWVGGGGSGVGVVGVGGGGEGGVERERRGQGVGVRHRRDEEALGR